jgi:hypothetical protein
MSISLTKPTEGATGWASAVNQNFTDIEDYVNARRLPTGYVQGLRLRWVSGTTLEVYPGECRDKDDAIDMVLASDASIDLATDGVNGLDVKTASGTASIDNASTSVTGSSTAFLSEFGTRVATGTYSSSGTAVTGVGTKFLREVAVGDLFGDSTNGFSRVTVITSDTSLTLSAALPNGDAGASTTGSVIENPTLEFTTGGTERFRINTIASNTACTTVSAATATHGSGSVKIGGEPSLATGFFLFVWLVSGTSGTQPIVSTQRTTPLNPGGGYVVAARRIGSLSFADGAITQFFQRDTDRRREYWYAIQGSDSFTLLSAGNSATPVNLAVNPYVPPTAVSVKLTLNIYLPSTAGYTSLSVLPRGITGSVYANQMVETLKNADMSAPTEVVCDDAQWIRYALSNAGGSPAYIFVFGYTEELS